MQIRIFKYIIPFFFAATLLASAVAKADVPGSRDFFLVGLPKGGTHLATKCLMMLTGRSNRAVSYLQPVINQLTHPMFAQAIADCRNLDQFMYGHTNPALFGPFFIEYAKTHPECVPIVMMRDLRDCIVSLVYHRGEEIKQVMNNPNASFEEMLNHILSMGPLGKSYERFSQMTIAWFHMPHVHVIRFEDLVGEQGGGSKAKQKETILALAKRLKISLSDEQLRYMIQNLFGNNKKSPRSGTFRSGQIGSWKEHYKPYQLELFKANWGVYQTAFGYPLD